MALLEFIASLPPLRIQALPDFKQSENTSNVTFGRASYITPISPKGTDIFVTIRPLGRFSVERTRFSGFESWVTARISFAIPSILSAFSFKRSYSESDLSIRARSFMFSDIIKPEFDKAASATIKSILSMVSTSIRFKFLPALTAFLNNGVQSILNMGGF
jgi:hypothetical protein